MVVREVLETPPDAGWHGSTPVWTPKYEYLHPLTNKFALNGQPSKIEKRRVWSTLFGECEQCVGKTAKWIDRYELTAGYYCDGCHKDYLLGSYLELELNRHLPGSVISEYQGFLGDNPDFQDFRLFEPNTLTYLGAGMGTGKTTEIYKFGIQIAQEGLGNIIIVVPRVALARELAYKLRATHGYAAWGLWHEGVNKDDKFVGDYGTICCLPSLPQVIECGDEYGVKRNYIAIDEIDFSYELLALSVEQSTAVKKILREAVKTTGLVVSGQTEFTLALEAFAEEVECDESQGFYNTAEPAEGSVTLKKHDVDATVNEMLSGFIEDINAKLADDQNVYSFCASRRDGDIIADELSAERPVLYNAYTKGDWRADALLQNQQLTDSRLFIGTSAAGVGISILDPKAITLILDGLIFGSRNANMAVQKTMRDRGRRGVIFHYKPYNLSLPVRPTENENISLYHELLKQATASDTSKPAIQKLAYAQALSSLADIQVETFFKYHLGVIGNMEISYETPNPVSEERAKEIGITRAEIRKIENELKIENAKMILASVIDDDTDTVLRTSSEIRKERNQGRLSIDGALANELANEAARAVGWDDVINRFEDEPFDDVFDTRDIQIARGLVDRNFDFKKLTLKRAGYLAVNAPKWTANRFELEVQRADGQLTFDGPGVEITAVKDYRLLGELLKVMLDTLVGSVFETELLAATVKDVLSKTATTGKTFGQELRAGALGASEYRKARFLLCAEDENMIVDWVARFISEWYPARLAKKERHYALQPDTHAELYLKAFECWLMHQPDVFDGAEIQLNIFEPIELPESNAEQKEIARKMRVEGATLKVIAAELGTTQKTVSLWCEGITPKRKNKQTRSQRQQNRQSTKQTNKAKKQERDAEVFRIYDAGETQQAIAIELKIGLATVNRILKTRDF